MCRTFSAVPSAGRLGGELSLYKMSTMAGPDPDMGALKAQIWTREVPLFPNTQDLVPREAVFSLSVTTRPGRNVEYRLRKEPKTVTGEIPADQTPGQQRQVPMKRSLRADPPDTPKQSAQVFFMQIPSATIPRRATCPRVARPAE